MNRLLITLSIPLVLAAQSSEPGEVTIRSGNYVPRAALLTVQSNLVEVGVTVRDRQGKAIGGFSVDNFNLTDNGSPRKITSFSELQSSSLQSSSLKTTSPLNPPATATAPAALPQSRYIALFFDDLHLALNGLVRARQAAEKLIAAGLQPGEQIGIFTVSGTVTVDFTSDAKVLLAVLPRLIIHPDPAARGLTLCPVLTPYQAYVIARRIDLLAKDVAVKEAIACDCVPEPTPACIAGEQQRVQDLASTVWDQSKQNSAAVVEALRFVVGRLSQKPGSRDLVFLSPGFPDGDLEKETSAVADAALRAHVVINSLSAEGLLGGGESPESLGRPGGARYAWAERTLQLRQQVNSSVMVDASAATGGRFIRNTNDLTGSLRILASAPEVSYLLGFQAPDPDGTYHHLKVRLPNRATYQIEARSGYFASLPSGNPHTAQQRIDSAAASKEVQMDVPVVVRAVPGIQRDNAYQVDVIVDIDASQIQFAPQGPLHLQQLTFVTSIADEHGNFVTGKQAVMDLRLSTATLARLQSRGIQATMKFSLPKGQYVVREVVRELVQDHLSALNTPVDLR
jgi:VWFA-related protein